MNKYLKLFTNHSAYSQAESSLDKPNVAVCQQEGDVHYNPDPYNGHEYVDLGLPSGTKWATMNVGANSETDSGLYFQWGETQGYADASTKAFSWEDYKYGKFNSSDATNRGMTKYNREDSKTELDAEDDAAHVNMGGEWHMPTKEQCEELFNTANCTSEWVTDYNGSGVNGHLFTSKVNGNKLFVPAVGYCEGGSVLRTVYEGYVWTSSLHSNDFRYARGFYFGSGIVGDVSYGNRCNGRSVRGVVG